MRRVTVVAMALLLFAGPVVPADAHHLGTQPHFRDVWCDKPGFDAGVQTDPVSRGKAAGYAATAVGDGYQWGGGCWNSDGKDDQPNDPPRDPSTGGEGGDCSGFVFKSWHLPQATSSSSFWHWPTLHYVHGPYTADAFRRRAGAPLEEVAKMGAQLMDAFASRTHIGMILMAYTPDGQDLIVEAANEAAGTGVWPRTYRSNANYAGVQRTDWATVLPGACDGPCGWVWDEG